MTARSGLVLALFCSALIHAQACKSYDAGLLAMPPGTASVSVCGDATVSGSERCDTAIAQGEPGACPFECPLLDPCELRVLVGEGCQAECAISRIEKARTGDGCCPPGVSAAQDGDCGSCGDGVIGPSETCDPQGSCATQDSCVRPKSCIVTAFSGDPAQCTSDCRVSVIVACANDDGCCPPNCSAADDDDCSASCGDGVLDASETCEPSRSDAPCPSACKDADPCTDDVRAGSPEQCNVECANVPIGVARDGDECCPPGANAVNDSDCAPICGNAVVEQGEQCDGGDQCDARCERQLHSALAHRYGFAGAASSSVVRDTTGGSDGSVQGGTLAGDGSLVLPGGSSGGYVELPCSIVSGAPAITIEAWVGWDGGGARQRIFDFGGQDGAGKGTSYMLLTPQLSSGVLGAVLNFTPDDGDTGNDKTAVDAAPLSTAGMHHLAVTFGGGELALYLDGAPVDTFFGITSGLSEIDLAHCWLGRSLFDGSPRFGGTFYELRVYHQALSPGEIAISASMGPDA